MAAPAETVSLLGHPREWTLDEFFALPEDQGERVELIDGALHVSPAPGNQHQRVMQQMQVGLINAMPAEFELLPGINVLLNGRRVLIPDLVVTNEPGLDGVYNSADKVLVAVEIFSPSSRTYDRALKRRLYAEAHIPFYWLVDPVTEPASAIAYELDGEDYREYARSEAGQLIVDRPFPVKLDLTKPGR